MYGIVPDGWDEEFKSAASSMPAWLQYVAVAAAVLLGVTILGGKR